MSAATIGRAVDESHDSYGHDTDGDGKERSSKGPKASTKSMILLTRLSLRKTQLTAHVDASLYPLAKDLSHVPCRFYKAGACTAGASCPFSHTAAEPGQPKGVCQWYIKGNCKFGHKCALAHVLPGQPMSMDRKNKRAEQQAAKNAAATTQTPSPQSTPAKDRERGDGKQNSSQEKRESSLSKPGTGSTPSGATMTPPGRPPSLSISSRPPMTIGKAAPTVSTIASDPSMHDAGFHQSSGDSIPRRGSGVTTSFAAAVAPGISPNQSALSALRPSSLSTSTTAQGSSGITAAMAANGRDSPLTPATGIPVSSVSSDIPDIEPEGERSPIPQSRPLHRPNYSSDLGFGPIGSPPAATRLGSPPARSPQSGGIALARARLPNGLSPPVSSPPLPGFDVEAPAANTIPPPSAPQPNSPSLFMPHGQGGSVPARMTSLSQLQPPPAAVGPHGASSGVAQPAAQRPSAWAGSLPASAFLGDSMNINPNINAAAEEGDLEDFLPSSLNELLTPGERSRRMSKSNLSRPRFDPDSATPSSGAGVSITSQQQQQRETVHAPQPRFVSSVPASSLLNNFRGIWDGTPQTNDVPSAAQTSSGVEPWSRNNGRLSAGISGSLGGADGPSPSLLGTSNASAAFLPGHMHRTAAASGLSQHNREPLSIGGASSSFDPRASSSRFNPSDLTHSPSRFNGGLGLPSSRSSNPGGFGGSGIFMSSQDDTSYYGMHDASSNSRQPHSSGAHLASQYMALSPTSARALRAHEPGQSLPQGLAAGLSRLHLVPATNPVSPSAVSASPSASMSMSVTSNGGGFAAQQSAYSNWLKSTSGEMSPPPVGLGAGGVTSPPRFANNGGMALGANTTPYPMLSRGASGAGSGRREASWSSQAQASPLSRPTVPVDEPVFDMDA